MGGVLYTKEDDEKIIRMYNQGKRTIDISQELGRNYDSIKCRIMRLRKTGALYSKYEFKKDRRIEKYKQLAQDLESGNYTRNQLAVKYNVTPPTIAWYIDEMRTIGMLPKKVVFKENSYTPRTKTKREIVPTLESGQTVKCTAAVSKMCVYGVDCPSEYKPKCRYSLITGKCRSVSTEGFTGCSPKACDKFSKITKENPRINAESESTTEPSKVI